VRASSHVLYLLSIVESTEVKQVYGVKLEFVSERTIKDHHHHPLWHPGHCPMGMVPRVLVRRTKSPLHADFGRLSSGAAPVVVRLDVVSFLPSSSSLIVAGCLLGGYPVGRDWWGGKRDAGGMSEDINRCFSMLVLGAFSTGVFQQHCITPHEHWRGRVGRIEHHDRCLSMLVLVYFAHRMGSV
jgi:hypothetical protein